MSATLRRRAGSRGSTTARRAARGSVLAGAADAGAAEARPTARSPISRPPASTPSRVRVPDHPVARAILAAFGKPVVAPSANRSGHVSPTTAQHVLADLRGRIDLIVDGGADAGRRGDRPSSPASARRCCCGRAALPRDAIEAVLGHPLADRRQRRPIRAADEAPLAPGMLASHYAPQGAPAARCATSVQRGRSAARLRPARRRRRRTARVLNLSHGGDLVEAAANLFSHLRALDAAGVQRHRRDADPARGPRRGDQRPAARAAAPRP